MVSSIVFLLNIMGHDMVFVFSDNLVCKEELNLMLKVIGLLVKVWWV